MSSYLFLLAVLVDFQSPAIEKDQFSKFYSHSEIPALPGHFYLLANSWHYVKLHQLFLKYLRSQSFLTLGSALLPLH